VGTASNYQSSCNALKALKGNVQLSEVTVNHLVEFEAWMLNVRESSKTTVGIFTRVFRVIMNEALERKLLHREAYPFGRRKYLVPNGRNIKKAISKEVLSKLYYAELESESQPKARDFWFFSFNAMV